MRNAYFWIFVGLTSLCLGCGDEDASGTGTDIIPDVSADVVAVEDVVDLPEDTWVDVSVEDMQSAMDGMSLEDVSVEDSWVAEDVEADTGPTPEDVAEDISDEDIIEDVMEDMGAPAEDQDEDGVSDALDNCPEVPNPNQDDCDGDDIGDACDESSDGDSIDSSVDVCPCDDDEEQTDTDSDGLGDACDPDDDNDGVPDDVDDFPLDDSESSDVDGDGIGDEADDDDSPNKQTVFSLSTPQGPI